MRENTDYNGTEIIFPIVLLYGVNTIPEVETILTGSSKLVFCSDKDIAGYSSDLNKSKKKKIHSDYIRSCASIHFPHLQYIEHVYVAGKHHSHPEIHLLNKGLDRLETKSDLYFQLTSGDIFGVSIKQTQHATKTNFSIYKLIDDAPQLKEVMATFLKENGITHYEKQKRTRINALFYYDNPYWIKLKQSIEKNKLRIIEKLVSRMFCSNVPYDIWEFDGREMVLLNATYHNSDIRFEEYEPFYYTSKGVRRNCAKLFYRLIVKNKIYKVEIRWKGSDLFTTSPQLLTHDINE